MVATLCRSLYGLKQSPRAWFEKFQDALLQLDFHPSPYDLSMFLHHAPIGITVLLVHVDDIIIIGTNRTMMQQLKSSLHVAFHMKDLGPLTYFYGLEVHQSALIDMVGLQSSTTDDMPVKDNVNLVKMMAILFLILHNIVN